MASTDQQPKQQKLILTTSDDHDIEVDRDVAERSILIKNLLDDFGPDAELEKIPIPNVSTSSLSFHRGTR